MGAWGAPGHPASGEPRFDVGYRNKCRACSARNISSWLENIRVTENTCFRRVPVIVTVALGTVSAVESFSAKEAVFSPRVAENSVREMKKIWRVENFISRTEFPATRGIFFGVAEAQKCVFSGSKCSISANGIAGARTYPKAEGGEKRGAPGEWLRRIKRGKGEDLGTPPMALLG